MAEAKKKSKKTSARKKKVKRTFTKGVVHIHATFNNTIVTVTPLSSLPKPLARAPMIRASVRSMSTSRAQAQAVRAPSAL